MNSQKTLIVIFNSTNVYSYINSITYAVQKLNINHIAFVELIDAPTGFNMESERFREKRLKVAIEALTHHTYLQFSKDPDSDEITATTHFVLPEKSYLYNQLAEIFKKRLDPRSIHYDFLTKGAKSLIAEYKMKGDFLVDLTGVPKRIGVELFLTFVSLGIEDVVTFELKVPPNQEKTLYHNLVPSQFDYVVIPKGVAFERSIEVFARKKNQPFLIITLVVIVILAFIGFYNYLSTEHNHSETWTFVSFQALAIILGITSLFGAWGALSLKSLFARSRFTIRQKGR